MPPGMPGGGVGGVFGSEPSAEELGAGRGGRGFDRVCMARFPEVPFYGDGSPTKADYRKQDTLILTSLLEDLDGFALGALDRRNPWLVFVGGWHLRGKPNYQSGRLMSPTAKVSKWGSGLRMP